VLNSKYPEKSTYLNYLSIGHPLRVSGLCRDRTEICARQNTLRLALLQHVRSAVSIRPENIVACLWSKFDSVSERCSTNERDELHRVYSSQTRAVLLDARSKRRRKIQ
jgi:hypothetical protein